MLCDKVSASQNIQCKLKSIQNNLRSHIYSMCFSIWNCFLMRTRQTLLDAKSKK